MKSLLVRIAIAFSAAGVVAALGAGCSDTSGDGYAPPGLGDASAGDGSKSPNVDGSAPVDAADVPCHTSFRYVPPPGQTYFHVGVTGDWNAFDAAGVPMDGPDTSGAYTADIELSPGIHAYKLVLDGAMALDPNARRHRYVNGVDNSGVVVRDCRVPSLTVASSKSERGAGGSGGGHYVATLAFHPGNGGPDLDPASVRGTLRRDGSSASQQVQATASGPNGIAVDVTGLDDGKYTLFVDARDATGNVAPSLRLVFWVEAEPFDWRDGVLYMAMNDRFKNANTSNDAIPQSGVDHRADFQGGDFEGTRQIIASGALDKLGVRSLWLSPFHKNTDGAFLAADNIHNVTGYHGYWPSRAREVDSRLGSESDLQSLVAEAHAHGIRVVMDFVLNHVHQDHEYFKTHPDWFRTGCICGTDNCDWTAHRLDCLFASYLPDVNWTKSEVSDAYNADAIWWVDKFDLDGLRVDAVKHVEDAATVNLTGALRDEFEASGNKFFMTGETAMGWNDCTAPDCPGNEENYGTISHYIGPNGLDGQFDFVLYHAASYRTFAWDDRGLAHADYWLRASLASYPEGAIMTPYIGSHDTPRSVTNATYRDDSGTWSRGIPGNQWDNVAVAPPSSDPYAHHRLALAWLYALPGLPLLYYGDEYGQWGGSDPNNRTMWHGDGALSADESATLAFTQKLGSARRALAPLRRGTYRMILATDDVLVFSRELGSDVVIVAMSRTGGTVHVPLPVSLPLTATTLHDWLGGPDVTVQGGAIDVSIPARSAAYLAVPAP